MISTCLCVCLVTQSCLTLGDAMDCPWDFSGQNMGVDCHFLLQGICQYPLACL